MGTEEFWVPLALSAAGAGTQYVNNTNAAKKQDSILADSITKNAGLAKQGAAQTSKVVESAGGSDAAQKGIDTQNFIGALRRNQGSIQGITNPTTVGNSSAAYGTANTAATQAAQQYGGARAAALAGITAPGEQQAQLGRATEGLGSNIDQLNRDAASNAWIAKLRAQNTHANPWVDAIGKALQLAGSYTSGAGTFASAGSKAGMAGLDGTSAAGVSSLANPTYSASALTDPAYTGFSTASLAKGLNNPLWGTP